MSFVSCPNCRLIGFALVAIFFSPFMNAADSSEAQILRHLSIYEKRDAYCAWPAIARTESGDLVVLFTRTEEHMAPNGEILLSRSTDNGETWMPPAVVYDTILDDRESGVTSLNDGRLLAHFRSVRFTRASYESMPAGSYGQSFIDRWIGYVEKPEYANATHLNRARTRQDSHCILSAKSSSGRFARKPPASAQPKKTGDSGNDLDAVEVRSTRNASRSYE